eukprot:2717235-Amphidinium_carterae.1
MKSDGIGGPYVEDVLSAYDSFALDSGVFFQTVTGDELPKANTRHHPAKQSWSQMAPEEEHHASFAQ